MENLEGVAFVLGCKVRALPRTYLGLPLSVPFNSFGYLGWDGIEKRFCKRLLMWKRQSISKEGRLTLIQSTLFSLHVYFMSLFQMSRIVRVRLEQMQKDSLRGKGNLEGAPHLMKGAIVCSNKNKGG